MHSPQDGGSGADCNSLEVACRAASDVQTIPDALAVDAAHTDVNVGIDTEVDTQRTDATDVQATDVRFMDVQPTDVQPFDTRPFDALTDSTTSDVENADLGVDIVAPVDTVLAPDASRPSRIYWGAYIDGDDTYGGTYGDAPWDLNTWDLFEAHAGKRISIIHWGVAPPWTASFNFHLAMHQRDLDRGTLELIDMSSGAVPLRDIASGMYDASMRTWLQQARTWAHPFFLRWNWEMNGAWFGWGTTLTNTNTPADFVAAWRHFHDLASSVGASNITWVFCPNTEFPGSTPLEQVYPGDAYVDWTCIDGYNKSRTWLTFSEVFAATYQHLLRIAPTRPIMIGETSSLETGGSKAAWITDALTTQIAANFPAVRALVWFNWQITAGGVTYPWPIESSTTSQSAFRTGIASSYYMPGGTLGTLPILTRIAPP